MTSYAQNCNVVFPSLTLYIWWFSSRESFWRHIYLHLKTRIAVIFWKTRCKMWIISMQALLWDMVICLPSTHYAWFEFSRLFPPCEGLSRSSFTAESITISQRWGLYFSQTPWWPLTSFIAFFFLENVLVLGFHLPPWCATNHCAPNHENVNH